MTRLLPEDCSVDSLQAELLRDAVAQLCDVEEQSDRLDKAIENLVYILNVHWIDQYNWKLTLQQEVTQ